MNDVRATKLDYSVNTADTVEEDDDYVDVPHDQKQILVHHVQS